MHYIGIIIVCRKFQSETITELTCIEKTIGQFAITYFHMTYKIGYVVGAIIIACCSAIVALYIFFKLREQGANQWYKRLISAMVMGIAVCGMHHTALVGTNFLLSSERYRSSRTITVTGSVDWIDMRHCRRCLFLNDVHYHCKAT